MKSIRLGVNIDHVATLRNARGGMHPDPVRAALVAVAAGADGITAHLREDRRHIRDADIVRLKTEVPLPLNLEMAATDEMLEIALRVKPHAVCIVPEKRMEITTEGGLDVVAVKHQLSACSKALKAENIRVSLFVDPDLRQIDAAKAAGADIVEIHTGAYCEAQDTKALAAIKAAALHAKQVGLECHGGHGLSLSTVAAVAAIPEIVELNIGHFIIGEAIFCGLEACIRDMKTLMLTARQ